MSQNINSQALVPYSPPRYPYSVERGAEFIAKCALQSKIDQAYKQGIQGLRLEDIFKNHLVLAADAYDLANEAEKAGRKDVADEVRKQVCAVTPASPPAPAENDPRFITPKLTGKYPVGVRSYYLEDTTRNERDLGHGPDRTRRVMIDVHYPGIQNNEAGYRVQPTYYFPDGAGGLIREKIGGWTRSQPGLEVAQEAEKFPIIFFSPGNACPPELYQHLVEELASQGFCVIAVNSPFISAYTPFLGHQQEQLPQEEGWENWKKRLDAEAVNQAKDVEFVLDQIRGNKIGGFEAFDSHNVGVFGHSLGGAAAAQICRNDLHGNIKAGINLDGGLRGDNITAAVNQPFLTILGGHAFNRIGDEETQEVIQDWQNFHNNAHDSHVVTLHNAKHMHFTMGDLLYDGAFTGSETPDTQRAVSNFSNHYIKEFFQKHLKGQPSPLFNEKIMVKTIETYESVRELSFN